MGRGRTSLLRALATSTLLVLAASCGRVSDSTTASEANGGAAGAHGTPGDPAVSGTAGVAIDPAAVALDTSNCAARREADCRGVKSEYSSDNDVFDESTELTQCSMFNSWDGCASIQFDFDAQGCAMSVAWRGPAKFETLPELRQCLSAALEGARWPCLALGTLRYEESCFIR